MDKCVYFISYLTQYVNPEIAPDLGVVIRITEGFQIYTVFLKENFTVLCPRPQRESNRICLSQNQNGNLSEGKRETSKKKREGTGRGKSEQNIIICLCRNVTGKPIPLNDNREINFIW